MGRLNDLQIRNWIRASTPVAKADGEGLTFTLSANGTASWVLRYRHAGKPRELSLGRYPDISLAEARKRSLATRAAIQSGVDVARQKQRDKRESARAWTFEQLAEDYFVRASERLAPSTVNGRRQQLRDYVYNRIGHLVAKDIGPGEIVEIIEKTAEKSRHVARLVLIALREVFAHGIAKHVVELSPCVHVKASAVIGPRPVHRTRIMLRRDEIRHMLAELPVLGRQNELMVRILLATATRIGELVAAKWEHVDWNASTWTIPAEHSKNGKPFVVPLSDQVLQHFRDLEVLAFGSTYVLPLRVRRGVARDGHMDSVTLNAAINRLCESLRDRCRRFTPHDLRSTARSHLGGTLKVDFFLAERCLNHSIGSLVGMGNLVDTYDRHGHLEARRAVLQQWSEVLEQWENEPEPTDVERRRHLVSRYARSV